MGVLSGFSMSFFSENDSRCEALKMAHPTRKTNRNKNLKLWRQTCSMVEEAASSIILSKLHIIMGNWANGTSRVQSINYKKFNKLLCEVKWSVGDDNRTDAIDRWRRRRLWCD